MPKLALVCLVLATAASSAQQPPSPLPSGPLAFVVDLDTTGGFTGRGMGGVTVDSGGVVRASRIGGPSRATSECRATLPADQLESLRRAVEAVSQPWPESFAPAGDEGCCDRYRWTLQLERRLADGRVQKFATLWYDGNESRLPAEVRVMSDVAARARIRALTACGRE